MLLVCWWPSQSAITETSTPAWSSRIAAVICTFSENLLLRGIFECGPREARGRVRAGAAAKVCVMVRGFGL